VWLNEGFTTYLETRIVEEVFGAEHATMILQLYRAELLETIARLAEPATRLAQDLATGTDPDDAVSRIAYDKGSMFLRMLEHAVGRERFDPFLRAYFDRFAFGSMDTAAFLDHLRSELLEPAGVSADDLGVERWVHAPGLPENAPVWHSSAFALVDEQVRALVDGVPASDLDTSGWSPHEWVHLLRALPVDVGTAVLADLDTAFGLSASRNDEILAVWLLRAVDSGHSAEAPQVDEALAAFLTRQGRVKFLRPLYEALVRTDGGAARAREIYAVARPGYHPVARGVIDRVVSPDRSTQAADGVGRGGDVVGADEVVR
jgi:hypothetical protein